MLGLVDVPQHFPQAHVGDVGVNQLGPVDGPLLEGRVDLAEGEGHRGRAQGPHGLLPDGSGRGTDPEAPEVLGPAHGLIGHEVAVALDPVEADHPDPILLGQALNPALDHGQAGELFHLLVALYKIGAVEDAELLHIVAEAGPVGVLPQGDALAELLDDVLLNAQLGAVEDQDPKIPARPLGHPFGPGLEARVVGVVGAQDVVEAQGVGLGQGQPQNRRQRRRYPLHLHHLSLRPTIYTSVPYSVKLRPYPI